MNCKASELFCQDRKTYTIGCQVKRVLHLEHHITSGGESYHKLMLAAGTMTMSADTGGEWRHDYGNGAWSGWEATADVNGKGVIANGPLYCYQYSNAFRNMYGDVGLSHAEEMVAIMSGIEKRLAKMQEVRGYPGDFADYAGRIVESLGWQVYARGEYEWNRDQWESLPSGEVVNRIRHWQHTFHAEQVKAAGGVS